MKISNLKSQISNNRSGFSILEVVLAVAIFVAFASGSVVAIVTGFNLNRQGAEKTIANQFNAAGMEAVRAIKNQAFTNLSSLAASYCTTGAGVTNASGAWAFKAAGTTDTFAHNASDNYTRTIKICPVERNIAGSTGNIVASGGVVDGNTYKATVTTTWYFTSNRQESVTLTSYFTNFRKKKGGILVYGNGGTTTDAIQYKTYDAVTNTWSAAAPTADIDAGTANRALRAIRVFSSNGRNEKIAVSRHYNGTTQYIYAQVFNGTTWGNVQLLSSWNASTFLDVLNFDGTYMANGDFMVVYSDNSVIPKYRIWNGSSWSLSSLSLTTLTSGQIPNYIVVAARPGTNEVMAAFFTAASDTRTQYFNGTAWSAVTAHATNAPSNTKRFIDFAWNSNTITTGALVYATSGTDRRQTVRLFVANGSGGGAWGPARNGANQANVLGAINIESSPSSNAFISCDKDGATTPTIVCRTITFSTNDPTISTPTNPIIAAATDNGIQRGFDQKYESISGTMGVIVYADNTSTPKLKKYNPSTTTWDSAATSISMSGFTPGAFRMVRMARQSTGDDMLVLMGDANLDVYSAFWDGSNNGIYSVPAVKAVNLHGTSGSVTTDYWFDFAWDDF